MFDFVPAFLVVFSFGHDIGRAPTSPHSAAPLPLLLSHTAFDNDRNVVVLVVVVVLEFASCGMHSAMFPPPVHPATRSAVPCFPYPIHFPYFHSIGCREGSGERWEGGAAYALFSVINAVRNAKRLEHPLRLLGCGQSMAPPFNLRYFIRYDIHQSYTIIVSDAINSLQFAVIIFLNANLNRFQLK